MVGNLIFLILALNGAMFFEIDRVLTINVSNFLKRVFTRELLLMSRFGQDRKGIWRIPWHTG